MGRRGPDGTGARPSIPRAFTEDTGWGGVELRAVGGKPEAAHAGIVNFDDEFLA